MTSTSPYGSAKEAPLTRRTVAIFFALAALQACERAPEEAPQVLTLEIRDGSEPVAHLVLEEQRVENLVCLVQSKCDAAQARLDAVVAQASSKGLTVEVPDQDGAGGPVDNQKPGDPYFDRALLEHFGGDGFTIHRR